MPGAQRRHHGSLPSARTVALDFALVTATTCQFFQWERTPALTPAQVNRNDGLTARFEHWHHPAHTECLHFLLGHVGPMSGRNQAQLDGLLHELRVGLDAKELHDSVLVELDGSRADVEQRCYFLH